MPVFVRAEKEAGSALSTGSEAQGIGLRFDPSAKDRPHLRADSLVSLSENGPFGPLGLELFQNDRLRAELALGLDIPQVSRFARARLVAPLFALPLLWLAWTDHAGPDVTTPNLLLPAERVMWPVLDVLAAALALFDGSRRSPHRRWLVVALVFGAAARLFNQTAETCTLFFTASAHGKGAAIAWMGAGLSLAGMAAVLFWLSRTTAPRFVVRQILDALEIDVDAVIALPEPAPPRTNVVVGLSGLGLAMCAVGYLMKERALAVQAGAALIVAFAGLALAKWGTNERGLEKPALGRARSFDAVQVVVVGLAGFLGAAFAARAIHQGFDAGGNLLRCRDLSSFEASGAKRQLLLEMVEGLSARVRARDTWSNTVATALVLPTAYEVFFRGALQRTLSLRYGSMTGLFGGALGYAVAASMTYESLFYRTVAAGLAFGLVYSEAGVVAAVLAHVLFAAHLLM
jgi:hypothetical protein